MSFRNSPWSGRPREGYFVRTEYKSISWPFGVPLFCSQNKEEAFEKLKQFRKEGLHTFVEDMQGNRIEESDARP